MDLEYTAAERAFRDEVRAFVRQNLPADLAAKVNEGKRLSREDFLRWHRILAKKGWVAAGWPEEFGGPGWTPVQQHIFDDDVDVATGAGLVALILTFGPISGAHFNPAVTLADGRTVRARRLLVTSGLVDELSSKAPVTLVGYGVQERIVGGGPPMKRFIRGSWYISRRAAWSIASSW